MNSPAAAFEPIDDDQLTDGLLTRRLLAWLVDAIIVTIICAGFWVVLAAFTLLTLGLGAPLFALLAVVPVIYGWLGLVSRYQASPGQTMLGLMVVRDADLGPPTALQALVYMIGYVILLAFGAIWAAVALVTTRHRTLHDMLSGLVVVRRSLMREGLPNA